MYKQQNRITIKTFRLLVVAALLAVGLAALAPPRPAHAATIIVNTTDDEYDTDPAECSLREAIQAANTDAAFGGCTTGSGADTITLPAGTYTLTGASGEDSNASGDLDVTSEITINGAGADTTIIQAGTTDSNGVDRVFHVVNWSGDLTLDGMTVRHGRATGSYPNDRGGGAYNDSGTVNVDNSTLSGNSASDYGGGIFNLYGTVNVDSSTISGNSAYDYDGGGVYNYGSVTINNSTISGNSAGQNGGGIHINDNTVTLTNSTLSGNSANRDGGGVYLQNSSATLNLAHCTLTNNTADVEGGGIYRLNGTVNLKNTIVAGNTDSYIYDDCYGSINSQGYNLVGSGTGCPSEGTGDLATANPKLDPLADNGGPTETHALQGDSPALNAIPDGVSGCGTDYTSDQRGEARPQADDCDAGAYEFTDYKYWDGGGADNNTSTAANWSDDTLPTASHIVAFSSLSIKDATVDSDLTVAGWTIASGYTGAITAGSYDLTVSGRWTQSGGTFTGGAARSTSAGTLTSPAGPSPPPRGA